MDQCQTLIAEISSRKYKRVIFDFDKTLVNLNIDYITLKKALHFFIQKKFDAEVEFTPMLKMIDVAGKKWGLDTRLALEAMVEKEELTGVDADRSNQILIDFIRHTDKKVGIWTLNYQKTVDYFLKKHQLLNHIDIVISNSCVGKLKPNPEGLYKILKHWGGASKEVAFVGDSQYDLRAGQEVNMNTFLININKWMT